MIEFAVAESASLFPSARIKVVGLGGAGCNMIDALRTISTDVVQYIAINTDAQVLDVSSAPHKIRIGTKLTRGRGAGANPEVGRAAAEEDMPRVLEALQGTDLAILIGGLGGGTASGALPIIAQTLKEHNIITVCIVTKPFSFEGKRRLHVAEQAEEFLKEYADILITIPNERLLTIQDSSIPYTAAFGLINEIIQDCVRSLTEIITKPGHINVDFADLIAIIRGKGTALLGTGRARGANRAEQAALAALHSPFLEHITIAGARNILINVAWNKTVSLHEIQHVVAQVTADADLQATIIIGSIIDDTLGDELVVTVIATGFNAHTTETQHYYPFRNEQAQKPAASPTTSSAHVPHHATTIGQLTKDHPLRDMLPTLEKRLKEQYTVSEDELEIPALLRKLMKEQQSSS